MALIKCSECAKEISSEAIACPFCGKQNKEKITTVQLTTKKWKAVRFISWIVFIIGIFIILSHLQKGGFKNPMTGFGIFITIIGFIGLKIGKLGAWWTNK